MQLKISDLTIKYRHKRIPLYFLNTLKLIMSEHEYKKLKQDQLSVPYWRGSKDFTPSNNGGSTTCVIIFEDENGNTNRVSGVANCSIADTFNYRYGRELAYHRALEALEKEGHTLSV